MTELLQRVAKFYYTDSNLGFTINLYPYLFAGIFTIGSLLLLGWILGFLEFDLARVLNDELGFGGGLSSYINNYGTSFTSVGYDQLSGDPIALLQSQVIKLSFEYITIRHITRCEFPQRCIYPIHPQSYSPFWITHISISSQGCRSTDSSCISTRRRDELRKLKFLFGKRRYQFLPVKWLRLV